MRNILLLAALLYALGMAAQPKNEARIADRIYLDSRDGHGGNQVWVMTCMYLLGIVVAICA